MTCYRKNLVSRLLFQKSAVLLFGESGTSVWSVLQYIIQIKEENA